MPVETVMLSVSNAALWFYSTREWSSGQSASGALSWFIDPWHPWGCRAGWGDTETNAAGQSWYRFGGLVCFSMVRWVSEHMLRVCSQGIHRTTRTEKDSYFRIFWFEQHTTQQQPSPPLRPTPYSLHFCLHFCFFATKGLVNSLWKKKRNQWPSRSHQVNHVKMIPCMRVKEQLLLFF